MSPHAKVLDSTLHANQDFTRSRVERVVSLAGGVAIAFFSAQALVNFFNGFATNTPMNLLLAVLIFGSVSLLIVACIAGRFIRTTALIFCVAYLIAVLAWPLSRVEFVPSSSHLPWLWMMINAATFAGLLFLPLLGQLIWLLFLPIFYALVLAFFSHSFRESLPWISLDASYALFFGAILLALTWMFRTMGDRADALRAEAIAGTALVAAQDAAEVERVEIAALMHDSVLAALISGAKAESPRQYELAKQMAAEALTRLADAESQSSLDSEELVPLSYLRVGLEEALSAVPARVSARLLLEWVDPAGRTLHYEATHGLLEELEISDRVSSSLTMAAKQAIANSVEHADAAGLKISLRIIVRDRSLAGIRIAVCDTGPGFDVASIPPHRLGVRGSIEARVRAVSGFSKLYSDEHGTRVELFWGEQ